MDSSVAGLGRFVGAVAVVAALITGSTIGASAATSSGSNGSGGGAFAGDTLIASAWENVSADFTVELPTFLTPEDLDVYHYRVGADGGTIVDFQPTDGLDALTEAEQEQWYVDSGLPDYEFVWLVFFCPLVAPGSIEDPTIIVSDPSTTLDQIVYRSIDEAEGFSTFDMSDFFTWHNGFDFGTAFEPEISQSEFLSGFSSNVQTELLNEFDQPYGQYAVLAGSYLDFSCPTSNNQPLFGRILNSSQPDDFAVGRSLPIGETIYFQPYSPLLEPVTVYSIASAGTYIGVTGFPQFNSNTALWGVTHVNDGVRALANTGLDADTAWVATTAGAILALTGIALVTVRRKRGTPSR
jgi:hypothetical protein